MAIGKLPLTKVVRESLIDAVNKINEIIDAVNKIVMVSSALSSIVFDKFTSGNYDYIYIQWNAANNYVYRLQINVTSYNIRFYEKPPGGNLTRKFDVDITLS